jgi:hypothetical protein
MARVEPVPNRPAAVVTPETGGREGERSLVLADYHAGIERGLRYERGVELESAADERLERLLALIAETRADRLVVLGDLVHRIGGPADVEAEELESLMTAVTDRVAVTVVPGNHDGGLADALAPEVEVAPQRGTVFGDAGFVHGHAWPAPSVLAADIVCMGHEHPAVRLTDDVGGSRVERAWLRGQLQRDPFDEHGSVPDWGDPELVVFPAFNDRSGTTWVNVEGQQFLAPFLPAALPAADVYLLDGTRLGDYRRL